MDKKSWSSCKLSPKNDLNFVFGLLFLNVKLMKTIYTLLFVGLIVYF